MAIEDSKIDISESGFIDKISNFWEYGIEYFTWWEGCNFLPHVRALVSKGKNSVF